MALPTIDQAFITKFNTDVHLAYQQTESKLRGTVRTDADVTATKVRFQKLGTLTAGSKTRTGEIPASNPAHSYVDVTMSDYYTLDWVDKLDLTKLNIDIRGNYVKLHAAAFARQTDDLIIAAMNSGYTVSYNGGADYTYNLDRNNVLAWIEVLDKAYVPDDMQRYALITPRGWNWLLCLKEFSNSQYVGPDLPFARHMEVRTWNGVHWIKSNRLPGAGTTSAVYFLWHLRAVGHGINSEVSITWDWENDRKAWSAAGDMSMGSAVIDPIGLVAYRVNDTLALPTVTAYYD